MSEQAFVLPPDLLAIVERQVARGAHERDREQRRARAEQLCGLAVLAMDTLGVGEPEVVTEVDLAVRDVLGGVRALATFERVVRQGKKPTFEQRRAAARAAESAPLGWALDKVQTIMLRVRPARRRK